MILLAQFCGLVTKIYATACGKELPQATNNEIMTITLLGTYLSLAHYKQGHGALQPNFT